jgi:hypothetical protein
MTGVGGGGRSGDIGLYLGCSGDAPAIGRASSDHPHQRKRHGLGWSLNPPMRDLGLMTRSTPWSDTPAPDEISRESDAHYSARSFVHWVRLEATTPS